MEQTIYDMVKDFLSTLGFPIFTAVYLLVFFRGTIRENTEALRELITYLKAKNSG